MSRFEKLIGSLRWLPGYAWQRLRRTASPGDRVHLIIALADHFEPSFRLDGLASLDEQEKRLERWCHEYPKVVDAIRDDDGRPFRHTYFYPAEQSEPRLIERLALHCHEGWGEIEIHLHHGVDVPDTAEHTQRTLLEFRDALASLGCLSRWDGAGPPRYAFVHGNWALANSANNQFCGVDSEMQVLADTGCYADLTLPSAPSRGQTAKINALYECGFPLTQRAPHRQGRDLRRGRAPTIFPLIVQGPLGLRARGFALPRIENGELTTANPATPDRIRLWSELQIVVQQHPAWRFIKLHCHGMDERDESAMTGGLMRRFLEDLRDLSRSDPGVRLHFVTAREMVNIMLAACDGRDGHPGDYRDYRLRPAATARVP